MDPRKVPSARRRLPSHARGPGYAAGEAPCAWWRGSEGTAAQRSQGQEAIREPNPTRVATGVGAAAALIGGALVASPGRFGPWIALTDVGAARSVGLADLALVPGLLAGCPRWPWMAARAARNLVIVALSALTGGDSRVAWTLLRASGRLDSPFLGLHVEDLANQCVADALASPKGSSGAPTRRRRASDPLRLQLRLPHLHARGGVGLGRVKRLSLEERVSEALQLVPMLAQ